MTDEQFPKGWKPNKLGQALGGPFIRRKQKGPRNLNEAIAKDGGKTATVTAAAKPRPIAPKSRRRR